MDLSFFRQMETRLGGGGDFAEAYVIAHEVGHHIQTLTDTTARVSDVRRRGGDLEGDGGLLVRQELQADCYSGVWAHHAQQRHGWLEPGDIEEALNTAAAIGDNSRRADARSEARASRPSWPKRRLRCRPGRSADFPVVPGQSAGLVVIPAGAQRRAGISRPPPALCLSPTGLPTERPGSRIESGMTR